MLEGRLSDAYSDRTSFAHAHHSPHARARTAPTSALSDPLFAYTLRLGDDALVLGQNLSAWCGHAPSLEVDLGLSNMALDLLGQATTWLNLAARFENRGRNGDTLAFHRDTRDFTHCRLVAQPNGDFAQTLARSFLYSHFQALYLEALGGSSHTDIATTALRAVPDVKAHIDFTTHWMIRLGDGACVSHRRLVHSLDALWPFVDGLFEMDAVDAHLMDLGISIDKSGLRADYDTRILGVLHQAGLTLPQLPQARPDNAPPSAGIMAQMAAEVPATT